MTATLVFQIEIDAPEKLAAYREGAGAALAKHGGAVTAASPAPAAFDPGGTRSEGPGMLAVLTFPDMAAAQAWIDDPALAELHALRNAAGAAQVWAL
ncbi:DUF1330 domain-containing protein [Rhodovulum sp. DZ06]|uniref:DUF1330 domain-containing protein n=1 Tax=Rhodovulum sp. DZ06 TaxID=3425126 RepID=UPI003D34F19D